MNVYEYDRSNAGIISPTETMLIFIIVLGNFDTYTNLTVTFSAIFHNDAQC